MPCEGPGFRLIQRPIWSGKFELHAHTSRRTVEVARAAAVSSRVRLAGQAPAISVALGGPKAAPVGTAPAPLGREASAATPKCVSAREPEGLRRPEPQAPGDPISVARTNWVAGGRAAAMSRIELPDVCT